MNTIPWYRSTVFTAALTAFIVQLGTMFDGSFLTDLLDGKPGALGRAIAAVITAAVAAVRASASVQPLSLTQSKADAANASIPPGEAGFARPLVLALLLALALPVVAIAPGCAGTQAAYREASSLDEYAYVLTEHYASLLKQAADLRDKPDTPLSAIAAMQSADTKAAPALKKLRPLAIAYTAVKSARTEAELQLAVNDAVLKLAELVRAVKQAGG